MIIIINTLDIVKEILHLKLIIDDAFYILLEQTIEILKTDYEDKNEK